MQRSAAAAAVSAAGGSTGKAAALAPPPDWLRHDTATSLGSFVCRIVVQDCRAKGGSENEGFRVGLGRAQNLYLRVASCQRFAHVWLPAFAAALAAWRTEASR